MKAHYLMHNNYFSEGYMLLSVISLSVASLLSQYVVGLAPLVDVVFLRYAIIIVLLIPTLFNLKNIDFKQNISIHLLRAAFMVSSQLCFCIALRHLSLSLVMTFWSLGPLFITLYSWGLSGKNTSKAGIVAVIISGLGALVIFHPGTSSFNGYAIFAILAALFNAGSQILLGIICNEKEESKQVIVKCYLFGSILAIILLFLDKIGLQSNIMFNPQHPTLLLLALVGYGLLQISNQYFRHKAYSLTKIPARLAPYINLTIIFSIAIDLLCYGQLPTIWQSVGITLVLIGCMLNNINQNKRRNNHV